MKATRLSKEDVMFAAILNDVRRNEGIRATNVPNAMLDGVLPTVSKISIPYREFNVILYKSVNLDRKYVAMMIFCRAFSLSFMSTVKG